MIPGLYPRWNRGFGAIGLSGWHQLASGQWAFFQGALVYTNGRWHQLKSPGLGVYRGKGTLPSPAPTVMPCISCTTFQGKIDCQPC
jgi:hypothetical protein